MRSTSSSTGDQSRMLLENGHGIAVAQPGLHVDAPEQDAHARVPHPVVVVGESLQAFELCWKAEPCRRQGRYLDPLGHDGRASYIVPLTGADPWWRESKRLLSRRSRGRARRAPGRAFARLTSDGRCASRWSPQNASRTPRPAALPTSLTRFRARWGRPDHEVDVYLPHVPGARRATARRAARSCGSHRTRRYGAGDVVELAGPRLHAPPGRPPGQLRPSRVLRQRRRRLPGQRVPLHDAVPRRARDDARREPPGRRHSCPRLGGRAGDPVAPLRLRRRPDRRPRRDRHDLPQPRLPRLGAALGGSGAARPSGRTWARPTASTCCARGFSRRTWSTRSRPDLRANR